MRPACGKSSRKPTSQINTNPVTYLRTSPYVTALAFSPDGKTLAVGGGPITKFAEIIKPITHLGLSDTEPGPARVQLFDVAAGAKRLDLIGVGGMPNDIAFSPNGKLLACSGNWVQASAGSPAPGVILWNAETGERVRTVLTETNGGAGQLAFSSDSSRLAVSAVQYRDRGESITTIIRVMRCATGETEWTQKFPEHAFGVEFTPHDSQVLVLTKDAVKCFRSSTGVLSQELTANLSDMGEWKSMTIDANSARLALGAVDDIEGFVDLLELSSLDIAHDADSTNIGRFELCPASL